MHVGHLSFVVRCYDCISDCRLGSIWAITSRVGTRTQVDEGGPERCESYMVACVVNKNASSQLSRSWKSLCLRVSQKHNNNAPSVPSLLYHPPEHYLYRRWGVGRLRAVGTRIEMLECTKSNNCILCTVVASTRNKARGTVRLLRSLASPRIRAIVQ